MCNELRAAVFVARGVDIRAVDTGPGDAASSLPKKAENEREIRINGEAGGVLVMIAVVREFRKGDVLS
jgi:hypothetical protein